MKRIYEKLYSQVINSKGMRKTGHITDLRMTRNPYKISVRKLGRRNYSEDLGG
jgi:hypothetical protein